jgi:hypothetical protein
MYTGNLLIKLIKIVNSWGLGLPLQKLQNTSFMQKMRQGAIGVTNPSYMAAGLATCLPQGILHSMKPRRIPK